MENRNSDKALAVLAGERALRTMDRAREGFWGSQSVRFLGNVWRRIFGRRTQICPDCGSQNIVGKVRDAVIDFKEMLDETWVSGEQWIDLCELYDLRGFVKQPIADWRARSRIDDARIQVDNCKRTAEGKMVAQLK